MGKSLKERIATIRDNIAAAGGGGDKIKELSKEQKAGAEAEIDKLISRRRKRKKKGKK